VKTFRFMGHYEGDPDRYRDDDERQATRGSDAIAVLRRTLLDAGDASETELDALQAEIEAAVSDAVEFARASALPDAAEVGRYVYPEQLLRAAG
jgi:acetoin:2,6-dichlorophenolindophenol oxidoreductase subunit alpha